MNSILRFALQLPVYFVINEGFRSLGYGVVGQIGLSVLLMIVYDIAERSRYEEIKN